MVVVLVGEPLDRLLRVKGLLEKRGLRVEVRSEPVCGEGYLNVSRNPLPEGCYGIRVPHVGMVPDVLEAWSAGSEDPVVAAALRRLSLVRSGFRGVFSVGGVRVPGRPPPVLVMSEVYVRGRPGVVCGEVERRVGEGADIVVLGLDDWGVRSREWFLRSVEACSQGYTVVVDPGRLDLLLEAFRRGAHGGMSVWPWEVRDLPGWVRDRPLVVLAGRDVDEAVSAAGMLGKAILDPVMYPVVSPGVLGSLVRLREIAERFGGPIMVGINNVYELIDADITGTIPLLVSLAAEGGASIVLVSEESSKAYGATLIARMAADLVSLALYYGSPPKDYPVRLLFSREKHVRLP